MRSSADAPEKQGVLGVVGEDAYAGGDGEGEGRQLGGFEAEALGVEEAEEGGVAVEECNDAAGRVGGGSTGARRID